MSEFYMAVGPQTHPAGRQPFIQDMYRALSCVAGDHGTQSLRLTKASIISGNLSAVKILLRHTKIENIGRHLGVNVEDTLTF